MLLITEGTAACVVSLLPGAQICNDSSHVYEFHVLVDMYKCDVFVCFDVCGVCLFCLGVVYFEREWSVCVILFLSDT